MFLSDDKIKDADFTPTLRGKQLLLEPNCRNAWQRFRTTIPLTDGDFNQYYTATVESFAEYVQNIPATRYSLYAQPYGFLHLGLDRAILCTKQALKAYQDFNNRTPDQLTSQQHCELFAVFSAALLNDLGLLNLRFRITLKTRLDQNVAYDPYSGAMPALGKAFCCEFLLPELTDWQAPASLMLAKQVLAHSGQNYKNSAFAWLSSHHHVLQLWYNLMLNISPREEDETRRTLLTLIPRSDAVIFQQFIGEVQPDTRGNFLSTRPYNVLFQDEAETNANERDKTLRLIQTGIIPSNEYTADNTTTDASNSRTLGSYGAGSAPRLAVGLAFLRWLQNALARGQVLFADEQTSLMFRTDQGLVLHWAKITENYAKHQHLQKITVHSAKEILKDLHKLAISSPNALAVREFSLKTTQGKTQFQGIVLDNPYILYSNKALPALTLGIRETSITHAAVALTAAEPSAPKPKLE
jgi:hypothetical protein